MVGNGCCRPVAASSHWFFSLTPHLSSPPWPDPGVSGSSAKEMPHCPQAPRGCSHHGGPCRSGHGRRPDTLGPYGSGPADHRHLQTEPVKRSIASAPPSPLSWDTGPTRKIFSPRNSLGWGRGVITCHRRIIIINYHLGKACCWPYKNCLRRIRREKNVTLSFQTCLNLRFGSNAKTGLAKRKKGVAQWRTCPGVQRPTVNLTLNPNLA